MDTRNGGRIGYGLTRKELLAGMGAAAAIAGTPRIASAAIDVTGLAKMLDVDPKYTGKGLTLDVGMSYPVTGAAAVFGAHVTDTPGMAFAEILAMGGPKFNMILKDNKSGDPQAGVQSVRDFGFAHVPMMLTSEVADLAAELTGIKQYKILSLDGSGGTSDFAQARKYFWGTIAITPDDAIPGAVKFIQHMWPSAKRIASCGWDLGGLSDMVLDKIQHNFDNTGFVQAASERSKMGATDYSPNIQKIKASNPDVVLAIIYGEDIGYFMKQYVTSGINKPVITFATTLAAQQIAGPAYEGLYFAFDYFDASRPENPWAKHFVDQYAKNVNANVVPDYYTANSYEDAYILWQIVMRTLKRKGNPKNSDDLLAALQSNPTFPSLYGGNESTVGTIAFDTDTHSVKHRPMMVAQFKNGKVNQLAHFDIGGADFKMLQ